jgi:hypothetical protein
MAVTVTANSQASKAGSVPEEINVFAIKARCWRAATLHISGTKVLASVASASKVDANVFRPAKQRFIYEK